METRINKIENNLAGNSMQGKIDEYDTKLFISKHWPENDIATYISVNLDELKIEGNSAESVCDVFASRLRSLAFAVESYGAKARTIHDALELLDD